MNSVLAKIQHECNMEKINLIVMNGTAYVWNAEDWMRVRELRVVGNLFGSLAALPRQDHLGGLPLALLKEETTLLLEKGYVLVKTIPRLSNPPDEDIRKKNDEYFERLFSEQSVLLTDKRKREIESKIDIIFNGKKTKRSPEEPLTKEAVLKEEIEKLQPIKSSALAIQISTSDPWLEAKDYQHYVWDYPKDKTEKLRYAVFKDLWERGYYITSGAKFGGDYLAYPGDPIKFHAFFIVICKSIEEVITMNEFITYGRLGQSVRKTVVLAYVDDDKVCYQSVQWLGF